MYTDVSTGYCVRIQSTYMIYVIKNSEVNVYIPYNHYFNKVRGKLYARVQLARDISSTPIKDPL